MEMIRTKTAIENEAFINATKEESKNCSPNFAAHMVAVAELLCQLRIADSWQWEELGSFLKETGAWASMKEKLGHLGWIELLENVFDTASKAQD